MRLSDTPSLSGSEVVDIVGSIKALAGSIDVFKDQLREMHIALSALMRRGGLLLALRPRPKTRSPPTKPSTWTSRHLAPAMTSWTIASMGPWTSWHPTPLTRPRPMPAQALDAETHWELCTVVNRHIGAHMAQAMAEEMGFFSVYSPHLPMPIRSL